MTSKLNVAVIFGGKSGEHEVSLASATSIMEALNRDKYTVIPIGITKQGGWLTAPNAMERLKSASSEQRPEHGEALQGSSSTVPNLMLLDESSENENPRRRIDVAIPALHGPFGEDGAVQGLLELAGIPYVGAGVLASAVGMDKEKMKTLFAYNSLPQVLYVTLLRKDWESGPQGVMEKIEAEIGYPAFVKPCNLGSSVGISKATDQQSLKEALDLACKYDRKIIVEEGKDCREVECSVLGNDEPIASLAGEIVFKREFYDYTAKYTAGLADVVVPADIEESVMNRVRRMALQAFKAIDCCGMARVDFFFERENGAIYLNEINTIPGFTFTSVYARLWEATGIGYSQLLDKLIELAMERYQEKSRSLTFLLGS